MPQPQQGDIKGFTPIEDAKQAANILMMLVQILAAPTEVILRKRFGKKALSGWPPFLALIAIPFWITLCGPECDPRPMWYFMLLFIAMQFRARVESLVGNYQCHSRYSGQSRLQPLLGRFWDEARVKSFEGLLVIVTGLFLIPYNEALGTFLMASGACMALVVSTQISLDKARTQQMYDAWIEQQQHAEQFREMIQRHQR